MPRECCRNQLKNHRKMKGFPQGCRKDVKGMLQKSMIHKLKSPKSELEMVDLRSGSWRRWHDVDVDYVNTLQVKIRIDMNSKSEVMSG